MKIPRFYQPQVFEVNQHIELTAENHRHAIQVLRLKIDEKIILFNGEEGEYLAQLIDVSKRQSEVLIESFDPVSRESSLNINLALAMIKPEKMDFAIQKAVEMGVSGIQPIYTHRSVIKLKSSRLEKKLRHWQGVITSACEQSGRTSIPKILSPIDLSNWLDNKNHESSIVMLPGQHPDIMQLQANAIQNNLSLLVGPEGGFTDNEEQEILANGINPISFGPRILRAETAVIAGITASQIRWGDLA